MDKCLFKGRAPLGGGGGRRSSRWWRLTFDIRYFHSIHFIHGDKMFFGFFAYSPVLCHAVTLSAHSISSHHNTPIKSSITYGNLFAAAWIYDNVAVSATPVWGIYRKNKSLGWLSWVDILLALWLINHPQVPTNHIPQSHLVHLQCLQCPDSMQKRRFFSRWNWEFKSQS